jgi:GT2 family glycosyltransferase
MTLEQAMIDSQIVVVMVTYGDRHEIVDKSVSALLSEKNRKYLKKIVLVDNNSSATLQKVVHKYREHVTHLALDENTGSAGGYWTGLNHVQSNYVGSLILTLDDDNEVCQNFFDLILLLYAEIAQRLSRTSHDTEHSFAISSYRKLRMTSQKKMKRKSLTNSFCDIRLFSRKSTECSLGTSIEKVISIESAPWGGLLFHQQTLDQIGLPLRQFFVYGDDQEYTQRMVKNGLTIYQSSAATILDLCESSSRSHKKHRYFQESFDENLLYYQIRNHTFTSESSRTSWFPYQLNKITFYTVTLIRSLTGFPKSISRLMTIQRAIADGINLHKSTVMTSTQMPAPKNESNSRLNRTTRTR